MNSQILGLRVASIIFGLMSLAQLLRLVIQPEVLVAGHRMPLWPSVQIDASISAPADTSAASFVKSY